MNSFHSNQTNHLIAKVILFFNLTKKIPVIQMKALRALPLDARLLTAL